MNLMLCYYFAFVFFWALIFQRMVNAIGALLCVIELRYRPRLCAGPQIVLLTKIISIYQSFNKKIAR